MDKFDEVEIRGLNRLMGDLDRMPPRGGKKRKWSGLPDRPGVWETIHPAVSVATVMAIILEIVGTTWLVHLIIQRWW